MPTGAGEIDSCESGSPDPGTDTGTGTGSTAAETVIDEWVGGNAKLEIAEVSDGTYYVSADYTGTLNGEPITG
jgi:hypothetical protein